MLPHTRRLVPPLAGSPGYNLGMEVAERTGVSRCWNNLKRDDRGKSGCDAEVRLGGLGERMSLDRLCSGLRQKTQDEAGAFANGPPAGTDAWLLGTCPTHWDIVPKPIPMFRVCDSWERRQMPREETERKGRREGPARRAQRLSMALSRADAPHATPPPSRPAPRVGLPGCLLLTCERSTRDDLLCEEKQQPA